MSSREELIEVYKWAQVQTMLYWAGKLPQSKIEKFEIKKDGFNWKKYLLPELKDEPDDVLRYICKNYCEETNLSEDAMELIDLY